MRPLIALVLFALSPLSLAADLNGLWVGYYAYDPGTGRARVECAVVLHQEGTEFAGTMIERQTFGEVLFPGLPSDIYGIVEGRNLQFSKQYVHDEDAPAVLYQVTLSPDDNTLNGYWQIGDASGTVLFRRVTADSVDRIPALR